MIPEESTQVNELATGSAQIVPNLSPSLVAQIDNKPGQKITSKPSVLNFYLGLNTHNKPFDDLRVREAIAYSLDVETMIKQLLAGYGSVANSLVQSTSFGWDKDLAPFKYDPDQAKKMLSDAGYSYGFTSTLVGGPGVWPVTREAGEAISGFLSDVGINAPMNLLEWGTCFDQYRNSKVDGLFLWGNLSASLDSDLHLTLNFHSPPSGRGLYWSSPDVEKLLDDARTDLDVDDRAAKYKQVQQILHDRVAAVPLWQYNEVAAYSDKISWSERGDYFVILNEVKPA